MKSTSRTIQLHSIDIPSPCTASWDKMKGDEQVRHCSDCNKNVFNLSAMPEAQAIALLADNADGHLCVRFYRRADGTVMTSDCSTSPRRYARQALRKFPAMASVAVLAMSAAGASAADVAVKAGMVALGAPRANLATPQPVQPVMTIGEVKVQGPAIGAEKSTVPVKTAKPKEKTQDKKEPQ